MSAKKSGDDGNSQSVFRVVSATVKDPDGSTREVEGLDTESFVRAERRRKDTIQFRSMIANPLIFSPPG